MLGSTSLGGTSQVWGDATAGLCCGVRCGMGARCLQCGAGAFGRQERIQSSRYPQQYRQCSVRSSNRLASASSDGCQDEARLALMRRMLIPCPAASLWQAGLLLLWGKWINFFFSLSGVRQRGAVWPSLSEAVEQKRDFCSPGRLAARAPAPLESITNQEIVLCPSSLQCVPLSAAPPARALLVLI